MTEPEIIQTEINKIFKHIHAHPELSLQEVQTTQYIFNYLQKRGFSPVKFEDFPGLYCDIGDFSESSVKIGVRADIDALWQEVNGVEQANHSCGHDAHTAMVIGAMLMLKDNMPENKGVRFVFQPAEEIGLGAQKINKTGIINDLDYMFGIHLRPIEEAKSGYISPSIEHGATGSIAFKIIGEDAHGARPHLNTNAIEIGSTIVAMLENIHVNPMIPHSIKVTKFHAGGQSLNIIPGSVSMGIDLRAQTNKVMDKIIDKVMNVLKTIEALYDVEVDIEESQKMVASESHEDAIDVLREAIISTVGEEYLIDPIITSGGDDFHFYTVGNPHLKGAMIGLGCNLTPGLHHPYMKFEHDMMPVGAQVIYEAIMKV
ncbi:amidohydrolase [Nosocomiicoccus sp. HMSC067E10]|uniref:amidohydrolase n=1 Tax=Nosocomiicoccus sp. HMSC067E10 TaxID=1739271 RepID=UPI0008A0F981|nr:amidohydrolase [Nosocomiicoccus sp. HMSC067E10]OFL49055.1 amidohydrolase [Nosocomiicoccus sp. HMSC067E10]